MALDDPLPAPPTPTLPPPGRCDAEFASAGTLCRGWWYPGSANGRGGCIVMAHGLGGLRSAGLEPYARRFAEAGFAVLLFDYRHFGASDGQPRQWVSVRRQLADWAAAVAFARGQPGVDPDRIALWGSSFSGGHVLVTAARDERVAALCAQGPMMDGLAATLNILRYAGIGQLLRLALRGLRDAAAALSGKPPVMLPLVGAPGTLAAMTTADAEPGYRAIVGRDWVNAICARFALGLAFYRPLRLARRVRCPALLIVADDSVAPASAALETARRLGAHCELHRWACGHFDIYRGAWLERGAALELDFLRRALGAAAPGEVQRVIQTTGLRAPTQRSYEAA
ncbi:MAG: alpha/beta hydrolase [Burkholderiaceae bacterium]|nr:alpha/beta hydrolase [Burkholderiaceae bacterium]